MKLKKYQFVPLFLIIYLVVLAIYTYPQYKMSGNWKEYYMVIGGTLLVNILLFFVLHKRERFRKRRKEENKNHQQVEK